MDKEQLLTFLETILKIDSEMRLNLIKFADIYKDANGTETCVIGSTADGCFTARWFHPDSAKHEIEIDLQHICAQIERQYEHLIELIPGKPDHVYIRHYPRLMREIMKENLAEYADAFMGSYLNPNVFRDVGSRFQPYEQVLGFDGLKGVLETGRDANKLQMLTDKTVSGTAVTHKVTLQPEEGGEAMCKSSIDNVPSIVCNFLPPSAQKFYQRTSPSGNALWPDTKTRVRIVETGCDIVPKSSPDGDKTKEWRWSFARAENHIMSLLSPDQLRNYFLVKLIFYRHVKPVNDDEIHSYWLKTAMLWFCEQHNPENSVWEETNIFECSDKILKQLIEFLDKQCLPHFFNCDVNLLHYARRDLLRHMRDVLHDIAVNIGTAAVIPMPEEFQTMIKTLRRQKTYLATEMIDRMKNIRKINPHQNEVDKCLLDVRSGFGQMKNIVNSVHFLAERALQDNAEKQLRSDIRRRISDENSFENACIGVAAETLPSCAKGMLKVLESIDPENESLAKSSVNVVDSVLHMSGTFAESAAVARQVYTAENTEREFVNLLPASRAVVRGIETYGNSLLQYTSFLKGTTEDAVLSPFKTVCEEIVSSEKVQEVARFVDGATNIVSSISETFAGQSTSATIEESNEQTETEPNEQMIEDELD